MGEYLKTAVYGSVVRLISLRVHIKFECNQQVQYDLLTMLTD